MNSTLQRIFSVWYSPLLTQNNESGASSQNGTQTIRTGISNIFEKYNIKSMFDAGCNDCNWIKVLTQYVDYQGGDISLAMVADVWRKFPDLNVILHDATTDPFPDVDMLFVRDVAIHLNDQDKRKLWQNWYNSNIPWILITHNLEELTNSDFQYVEGTFPFSSANWNLAPWNFSEPTDLISEYGPGGRSMALWHRDQFKGIL